MTQLSVLEVGENISWFGRKLTIPIDHNYSYKKNLIRQKINTLYLYLYKIVFIDFFYFLKMTKWVNPMIYTKMLFVLYTQFFFL